MHKQIGTIVALAALVGVMWFLLSPRTYQNFQPRKVDNDAPNLIPPATSPTQRKSSQQSSDGRHLPLIEAMIMNYDREGVARWLRQGGDPNATTVHGVSLLRFAVWHDRTHIADILLNAGANLNPEDGKGDLFDMAVYRLIGGGDRTYYRENPRLVLRLIGPDTVVRTDHIRVVERRQQQLFDKAEQRMWQAKHVGDLVVPKSLVNRAEALGELIDRLRSISASSE